MKRISQQQIARELGVSQSLVSIVLNGRREGISEETYDKIWQFALEHGYSPKGMKLNLDAGVHFGVRTVGYFLRKPLRLATKSNFFSHVLQGLHEYLDEKQIHTVFLGSESDFDPENLKKVAWQTKYLKGIVIMGEVAPEFLEGVRRLGKPVAYVSARSPGMCHSVTANEKQSGEQLVDHLTSLGHRHFAYFGGLCARGRNKERYDSFRAALDSRGISFDKRLLIELDDAERKEGYIMSDMLLQQNPEPFPTAIVCVNGLLARGVISNLYRNGFDVGRDISVAAYDMTRVCSDEVPGITSASAIPEKMGAEAGRILLETSEENLDVYSDIVLPSSLVIRESSGPVSAIDPAVRSSSAKTHANPE